LTTANNSNKLKLPFSYNIPVAHRHHHHFMAIFPGLPRWAGARGNLLLDFMEQGEISEAESGWVALRSDQSAIHLHQSPHFYAGCPSCRNT